MRHQPSAAGQFQVLEDALDDLGIVDEGDDAH
jgi:hypothetical protein